MTAYVVAADPVHVNSANYFLAELGFYRLGYFVERYALSKLAEKEVDSDTPVFGGIESIHQVFPNYVGLPYYPEELTKFLFRNVVKKALGEVLQGEFFKPLVEEHKLFSPRVMDDSFDCQYLLGRVSPQTMVLVLVSEAIEFVSEFRVYVLNGEILNVCFYKGNPLVQPNPQVIQEMVKECRHYSYAFGLDVGVISTGETSIVELNDFCCLGNYGLRAVDYAKSIETRWQELWRQYFSDSD